VVETFMIPHLRSDEIEARVKIVGNAQIHRLQEAGKGIVLVTAHLGSWELGGLALAKRGYKITTVAGVQFTPGLSPLLKAVKQRAGITVVSARSSTLTIVRALRKGEIVALHVDGDQYMGGVKTKFFGRETTVPRGPAVLSLRTGAALVPAFAIRTGRGRVTVHFENEIPHMGEDVKGLTAKIMSVIEEYVRSYPDQWCIFRRFWEQDP
jgi:KDO2-lipid IV(A) lauroyltransferase